ncbi:MAG: TorF family putative porin [Gammaproteobacteria bacterium]|jgi:uncharacterized protein (TIGR02001 family)|nr:TorF family putative porin [Gammaproteobacteria bacterium]MBQ0774592.1 TorF family putative porin [Gammaproteobacteria bacterium]|tara:strand:- start:45889 stop:46626 length:738 start_codon:yes stop_codon:yes gene_type:complete
MSMKTALKMTALAAAISATAVPMTAAAEVSGSLGIANTYLWRGMDLSAGGAQVHGSLDYAHSTGLYTGVWGSSEAGKTEYDLYAGFAGEAGSLSYDIAYVDYNYPNYVDDNDPTDTGVDFQEVIIGLGFAGVSLTSAIGVGDVGHDRHTTDASLNKDNYFNLSYTYDKFTAAVGTYDKDADESNYSHVDLTYALNDSLSFTASKVVASDDCVANGTFDANMTCTATTNSDTPDDTLFVVSYSFPL